MQHCTEPFMFIIFCLSYDKQLKKNMSVIFDYTKTTYSVCSYKDYLLSNFSSSNKLNHAEKWVCVNQIEQVNCALICC